MAFLRLHLVDSFEVEFDGYSIVVRSLKVRPEEGEDRLREEQFGLRAYLLRIRLAG